MRLEGRISRLETKTTPTEGSIKFVFYRIFSVGPERGKPGPCEVGAAKVVGSGSLMSKADDEQEADFLQRVYRTYCDIHGLASRGAGQLSDLDLNILTASGSPELAAEYYETDQLDPRALGAAQPGNTLP